MKFRTSYLLIATAGIAVLLSVALIAFSPLIRLSREIDGAQYRVINEFDHVSIRDAALELLSDLSLIHI